MADFIKAGFGKTSELSLCALLLAVVAGLLYSFQSNGRAAIEMLDAHGALIHWPTLVWLSFPALAIFLFALRIAARKEPFPEWRYIVVTTVVALALRGIYVAIFDATWMSDFRDYWLIAVDKASRGDLTADGVYAQRALPVLYPIARLFGAHPGAVEVANIGMLTLTQWLGYGIVRRFASRQSAQAFALIFLFTPVPLYSTLIPSHDLWGMFFTAAAFWFLGLALSASRDQHRWWLRVVVSGLCASVFIVLLQLQRGLGTLLLVSLVLVSLAFPFLKKSGWQDKSSVVRNLWLVTLACTLGVVMLTRQAEIAHVQAPKNSQSERLYASYFASQANSFGNGGYWWYRWFRQNFADSLAMEQLQSFKASVVVSDWIIQPEARLASAGSRMKTLYKTSDTWWYFRGPDKKYPNASAILGCFGIVFSFAFSMVLIPSILHAASKVSKTSPVVLIMGVFMGAMTLALSFFAETQPRYSYSIWFIGTIYIAMWMSEVKRPLITQKAAAELGVRVATTVAFFALGLFLAWVIAALVYREGDGRIVTDWAVSYIRKGIPASVEAAYRSLQTTPLTGFQTAPRPVLTPIASGMAAILEFPEIPSKTDRLELSKKICRNEESPAGFSYYLYAPYEGKRAVDAFFVTVSVDGKVLSQVGIPTSREMKFIHVPAAFSGQRCQSLKISLISNVEAGKNKSWQRASRAEIYFPHLTPM